MSKLGAVLIYLVVCVGHTTEIERFYGLRSARTPGEFEVRRREFNLREAAAQACRWELSSGRVPINCYRYDLQRNISAPALLQKCITSAQEARDLPAENHWKLLPSQCQIAVAVRQRLLVYKAGKDFE